MYFVTFRNIPLLLLVLTFLPIITCKRNVAFSDNTESNCEVQKFERFTKSNEKDLRKVKQIKSCLKPPKKVSSNADTRTPIRGMRGTSLRKKFKKKNIEALMYTKPKNVVLFDALIAIFLGGSLLAFQNIFGAAAYEVYKFAQTRKYMKYPILGIAVLGEGVGISFKGLNHLLTKALKTVAAIVIEAVGWVLGADGNEIDDFLDSFTEAVLHFWED